MKTKEETHAEYLVTQPIDHDAAVISEALGILRRRFGRGVAITTPASVWQYLTLEISGYEHEVFGALWMDTRHRVIEFTELFTGTIDGAGVYPREVVKRALALNAAAVIFTHNHPSGVSEPSASDKQLTQRLTLALELVDVRVLDHIIVGAEGHTSMAERGMM